jgi:hypothetical protein
MPRAWVLFAAVGTSEVVRLTRWMAPLSLRADSPAPPEAIAALVRDVEREPQLVPGVRRVSLIERSGSPRRGPTREHEQVPSGAAGADGWVCYEVAGVAHGLPWRVRFRKGWEGDQRFWWRSEGGTGRPEQYGALWLLPRGTGTRMELRARTRSALPLAGGAATLLVNPLFLRATFSGWLRNLSQAGMK